MGKDTTQDVYADMDACEKDDIFIFSANGIVVKDEHTNKCPDNPQSSDFTYKLLENYTKIAIYDSNPDTLDLEVTSNQFKLSKTSPNSSGIPITYTETYNNIQ